MDEAAHTSARGQKRQAAGGDAADEGELMTKYYLSGQISSDNPATMARNKAAFRLAQYDLAKVGIVGAYVVNPIDVCADLGEAFAAGKISKDELWNACMRRCIAAMMACDEMIYLPGFENSRGARIEHGIAYDLQMPRHALAVFLKERS